MTQHRILIVDDNEANRYAIGRILRKEGYDVDEAATGGEALERVGDRQPALVILDIRLPDIDGFEICRRIKANPTTCSVLVLNMSASLTRTADRVHGLDSGADGYLAQPIDPMELTATVRSLLRIRDVEARLRRSNEDLEMFAHAAAHDLKEPLRMVSSYLDLLEQRGGAQLDERTRRYLRFASDGASRMGRLIDMLLALAAVDPSVRPLAEVDCGEILRAAIRNLELQIRESGGSVEAGAMPVVCGDADQLVQVFQNLLANALKFRGEASPAVRVTAVDRGRDALISVSDNGIGISTEHRERVFGMFQRLHPRDQYAGTGLGLTLCRKIIERHGGRIWIESSDGPGTTVTMLLPKPPCGDGGDRAFSGAAAGGATGP